MKKLFLLSITALLILVTPAFAQEEGSLAEQVENLPPDEYRRAQVIRVLSEKEETLYGIDSFSQEVEVKILEGEEKGSTVTLSHQGLLGKEDPRKVKPGEKVIVLKNYTFSGMVYSITDKMRLKPMGSLALAFLALVVLMSGWRGLGSLAGLVISVLVLVKWVVPGIAGGGNPLLISLTAAIFIAVVSIYIAHGFGKRTSLAVVSTLITLLLSAGISVLMVTLAKIYGTGSEEAFILQLSPLSNVNLQGLLLGGMIIGALGVLDDITTAQTAAIEELHKLHPGQKFKELYGRGLSIGREHIASLVNTLALAYMGASMPLFMLFHLNRTQPTWMIVNSEFIAEEIIRTLSGSVALVLAVPIATALAAYFYTRKSHA